MCVPVAPGASTSEAEVDATLLLLGELATLPAFSAMRESVQSAIG